MLNIVLVFRRSLECLSFSSPVPPVHYMASNEIYETLVNLFQRILSFFCFVYAANNALGYIIKLYIGTYVYLPTYTYLHKRTHNMRHFQFPSAQK